MSKNVPRFLDLDLDEQHRSSLFQAWMYSEPEVSFADVRGSYRHVVEYDPSELAGVCSASTQTAFSIPCLADEISVGWLEFYNVCGEVAATAAPVYPDAETLSHVREGEPENASIEDERVIAFRAIPPRVRTAIRSGGVRLSADATQLVVRARGRRLRFEEDPERQSE